MTVDKRGGHKDYGDYGRLPDNVFEGCNPEKTPQSTGPQMHWFFR
ncbi:MAG TPA: hypothetical protein PK684_03300 [Bacillota bacterium]|jgi:hypothetical protein|nr:hypothetical protein [Bacillota bacterium]